MENALGGASLSQLLHKVPVSILVVMENALGDDKNIIDVIEKESLNPCCNGKCSWRVI